MADYSTRRYGALVLQNLLMAELVKRGRDVVEPGVLREVLLDHQAAARGGVSERVLGILREQLGVCLVVTGEVEEFSLAPSGADLALPSLDFGLRLIDARQSRLVASIDLARDGDDGESVFGRGREYSLVRLARACMAEVAEWISEEEDR